MKEKMIDWFKSDDIKTKLKLYGLIYIAYRVDRCVEYIKLNRIDDSNAIVELMCASLYYNINNLSPIEPDYQMTKEEYGQYCKHRNMAWFNLKKNGQKVEPIEDYLKRKKIRPEGTK